MKQALREYFERMKQAEFCRSFKKAAGDPEMNILAEEGLEDYLKILDKQQYNEFHHG
jgi:hypothetical protein